MKNSKVTKMLIMVIIGAILVFFMIGQVKADDYQDLGSAINGPSSSTNNTTGNTTNNTTNNTSSSRNNTTGNSASSTLNSTRNNTLTTNSSNRTNNSSTYNNTTLPKTGLEDSIPVVVLAVVFAISAAYAFKKIKDYKNI